MKRRGKLHKLPTLFISGNLSRRIPLFRVFFEANRIFLDTLEFRRRKYGFKLRGFVLMPDPYHLLLTASPNTSLSALLRDFKSFVGLTISQRLARAGGNDLLQRFQLARPLQHRKNPRYRVLQYDNNILEVYHPL